MSQFLPHVDHMDLIRQHIDEEKFFYPDDLIHIEALY